VTRPGDLDLTDLRRTWQARREVMRVILRRIDPRGMRRPARDPEERAWLEEQGASPFVEDETIAIAAREFYRRKYQR
jgi:hypothetical protein